MDVMLLTHRELRAALHLAYRDLKRGALTPRRARLLTICKRTLDQAKAAAVATGVSKVPRKGYNGQQWPEERRDDAP